MNLLPIDQHQFANKREIERRVASLWMDLQITKSRLPTDPLGNKEIATDLEQEIVALQNLMKQF